MDVVLEATETEADRNAEAEFAQRERQAQSTVRRLLRDMHEAQRRAEALKAEIDGLLSGGNVDEGVRAQLASELSAIHLEVLRYEARLYGLISWATHGRHTPDEIQAWSERAVAMGCNKPRLGAAIVGDLIRERKVPNAPLRERAEELVAQGVSFSRIANRALDHLRMEEAETGADLGSGNLTRADGSADITRLERILGIRPQNAGGDSELAVLRLFIPYEVAVAISRALDMNPTTAGV